MRLSLSCLLCLLTMNAFAQWDANNTATCTAANDQQEVRMVTDGQGGAILAWDDVRVDGQNGDIYAQRLDHAGVAQWTANGIGICTQAGNQTAVSIADDGAGGAIMVWNDWRSGNRDIYAQKVDAAGAVQWTANGVAAVVKPSDQQDAKVISDDAGGAIFVWQDSAAGGFDVYAQRIGSAGTAMWAAGGVAICTAANDQVNPRLETDGAGGAIITWQDKRGGNDYDIAAQRVDASGTVQWTANGIVVATLVGTQSNPKIEPDGAGGVYICWQDKRTGNFDVYAQRVNSAGAVQWTANGVALCTNAGSQSALDMTAKGGIDGAIIAWKDDRAGLGDIYARRISAAGVPQWAANGIVVASGGGPELKPNIIGDGSGNAIIVWQDSSAGNWDVMSSKVDGNGTILWNVAISTAAGSQTNPKNVEDGAGGAIYAWQDKRNTLDFDIYAHHINAFGTITAATERSPTLAAMLAPNPFSSTTTLSTRQPLVDATIRIYSAMGQLVKQLEHVRGKAVSLDRAGLENGCYFLSITQGASRVASSRLIVTD